MQYEFTIYRDSAGGFRWRLQAGNNRIVADSGESYVERSGAKQAAERVRRAIVGAQITIE
ncbi:MAG: YegP family protein [Actinomycetota bacterium]|nr:YegP family protein [Actinomycetota bacterium]